MISESYTVCHFRTTLPQTASFRNTIKGSNLVLDGVGYNIWEMLVGMIVSRFRIVHGPARIDRYDRWISLI